MAKRAAGKPTRSGIDALVDKGFTVKQIAEIYQCSVNTIATIKSRKPQGWREDGEFRNPIKPEEIEAARQVPEGTRIEVDNLRKAKPGDGMSWGVREEGQIVKKYPHIVLLANGMTVDYAEVAMQMREEKEAACL